MHKPPRKTTLAVLATLSAMALSGCIGSDAPPVSAHALALHSDTDEADAGQTVRFAAQAENDNATAFLFDFGDGTTQRIEGSGAAEAEHAYASGGAYTATVSLMEDNASIASAMHAIHVVDRVDHDVRAVASGPLSNETSTAAWEVHAGSNATAALAVLRLENAALVGQSVLRIDFVDANGTVIATKTVSLAEGESKNATLSAPAVAGLALRVTAEAGAATAAGGSTIRYA